LQLKIKQKVMKNKILTLQSNQAAAKINVHRLFLQQSFLMLNSVCIPRRVYVIGNFEEISSYDIKK